MKTLIRSTKAALAAAKPTVTVGEGTMASGGYWVGSAANAVFIEGSTDMVGSIGVYQRVSWDTPTPSSAGPPSRD